MLIGVSELERGCAKDSERRDVSSTGHRDDIVAMQRAVVPHRGAPHAPLPAQISVRSRTRSYAALVNVKIQATYLRPRCCSLRKPPIVLPQPKPSSINSRFIWLTVYPACRVSRCALIDGTLRSRGVHVLRDMRRGATRAGP